MATPGTIATPLSEYLASRQELVQAHDGRLEPASRAALASELRQKLASYAAYIPSRLVHNQIANPVPGRISGAFWYGSLLFADLSGFTSLSEQLSVLGKQGVEEVSAVVNQLFNALVDEVLNHQGALLKFGGDALTAFYDDETLGPAHAVAATLTALAMQERMKAFSALKTRKGTFRLQLRVGVHSGKVFAAEVGDRNHIELVVTSREVNRVATAQEIAAPGEVVFSDYTAALLEGAITTPRRAGFQQITALPEVALPSCSTNPIRMEGSDDSATLELLAAQVAALRPYLVRNLPSRFLDATVFEMGEFRPVTVLFANFHDFSATLAHLADDPMRAALILNAYFQRAQTLVHRYDGIVNKVDMYTHGDKLMALFGAPNAHEDDPLRAVRCALELQPALEEANAEIANLLADVDLTRIADSDAAYHPAEHAGTTHLLQQRIGINTGSVFAGRVGGARRYEYTVMGSTVNLSARLMAATEDATILLSPITRAAVAHQIATAEQPPLKLKGLSEPVVPARALHVFEGSRTPTRPSGGSISRPPLVGRDAIVQRFLHEAATALWGSGRVLALVGDAGIGKTRLVEELIHRLVMASFDPHEDERVPVFQLFSNDCQSYEQSMPYATIRPILRHMLGLRSGNTSSTALLEHMERRVEQLAPGRQRFTILLGDVFGITLPDSPLTEALSTEQRHDRVQELIVDILLGTAAREPLLISLEDIQWADASSLELLARLSTVAGGSPMLLLLNYRHEPPIAEPWADISTTTRLALSELDHEDSAILLSAMLNGTPPPEVLSLLERTQGNPLFIEELVRTLIDSEALAPDNSGSWMLTRPLDQVTIPGSIEGLIYARLDRLDESQYELVQVASVIGRRFTHTTLEGILTAPERLDDVLQPLIEAEIILNDEPKGTEQTERSYLFRHALLRDVAYEGILYARRRELHCRVAQCIEQQYFGHLSEYLTVVGRHYLLAEEWMIAYDYHKTAGIQAQRRYANHEALTLYATAQRVIPEIEQALEEWQYTTLTPDTAPFFAYCPLYPLALHRAELHERSGYLSARMGEGEQAEQAYLEALRLVEDLMAHQENWRISVPQRARLQEQISHSIVRLHRHLATLHEQHTDYEDATDWLNRGMEQITRTSHDELARCYLLGARIYYVQGKFDEALDWSEMGLAVAEYLDNIPDQAQALLRMGNIWKEKGDLAQSIPSLLKACNLFEQANHMAGLNNALNDLGVVYYYQMRRKEAINCYGRSLQISENIGDAMAMARTSMNMALVLVEQDELDHANELYTYSREQFRRVGSDLGVALTGINRATVLLMQHEPQAALTLLDEAMDILERINARIDMPETLRLAAEAHLELGRSDQATACAVRSQEIAHELGMTLEEGVALRVLGQIALHCGDIVVARDYLEQSCTIVEQVENRTEYGKVLHWLARLCCEEGQFDQTDAFLHQAEQLFQELESKRDLQEIRACMTEVEQRKQAYI